MADKVIYWSKTALTGGAAGALDSIDGTGLQDGEVAHVWVSNVLYIYLLDVDSAAAESSPAIIAPDTNAGDKRWILQSYYSGSGTLYTDHIAESTAGHGVEIDGVTLKDSGFALGSDADGDMYYRASSALARLAKGTANFKQFMNAAGTAPEWGDGYAMTSFSRDMTADSGDVNCVVATFVPRVLITIGASGGTMFSVGFSSGTVSYVTYASSASAFSAAGATFIYANESAGVSQSAVVKTIGATTVLTWKKTGSPAAGNFYFAIMAFR